MSGKPSQGRILTRRSLGARVLSLGAAMAAASCSAPGAAPPDAGGPRGAVVGDLPPPTGRRVTVDGRAVHADVQGAGRDVVLLHGAGGNARDFTFALAPLLAAQGYRAISFDRPGLGWSEDLGPDGISPLVQARHLSRAAQALGVRRPIVLGHSYGGAVAMAWALTAPDNISGLVSVAGATNVWPGGVGLWYDLGSTGFGRRVMAPALSGLATPARIERAVASIFAPNPIPEGYVDHIGVGFSLEPGRFSTNARQVAGLKPHLRVMEPRYGEIGVPLAIVFGAEDDTVPVDVHGARLARQLRGARLEVLPGVGHMPHHARPDAILAALAHVARG